ncbi:MAG TPA: hypothetical protein VEU08_11675 [Vicinamibacterales bacterium]|nr:hypothetical protein [Vicinamibacterales bacterium]
MLYAAAVALALLFAALAYVARRGLHPAIEGLAAGAVIAVVTQTTGRRAAVTVGLIAVYAVIRAVVRRVAAQV